jgi:CubicO group peptidase (beta-lactamase class C family)
MRYKTVGRNTLGISRRRFLKSAAATAGSLACSCPAFPFIEERALRPTADLDDFITSQMEKNHLAGLGACIIKGGEIIWSNGYGWADFEKKVPYDPENTVQNIGSVSKTFTATAVMQLWEKGKFKLDDDINAYLPIKVINPSYPDIAITFRQLLTHRSSIMDGPAYGKSYACGDPTISLEKWIRGYFTPGGEFYDGEKNFHEWRPGQEGRLPSNPRPYSNVAFGLLGYLVERIAGIPFSDYCRTHIFKPLGMTSTSWYLKDLDTSRHAIPYTYLPPGKPRQVLSEGGWTAKSREEGGYFASCLYSFPNYPDGLIRTSVSQLAQFLIAYIQKGTCKGDRLLKPSTVETMLSRDHFGKGLCWFERPQDNGDSMWGHGGGDPGIATTMQFLIRSGVGVIVFTNTGMGVDAIRNRLLQQAAVLHRPGTIN